jgi:hypothetical protein
VVAEHDPLVRLHEVLAVIMHLARRGAAVIEHEHASGDPFRVEAVADRVGAERREQNVDGIEMLAAMQGNRAVGERAEHGDCEPDEGERTLFTGECVNLATRTFNFEGARPAGVQRISSCRGATLCGENIYPMKKSLLSISLHAATVCAFALLSPSAVAQTSATSTTGAGGTTAAGAKAKPLSAAEKKFIKDASESVYYALHLTGMAEKNASATPTKEVAKSIKEDGDKIWEELGAIAQAKGEKMTTDLSGGDKSSSERLGKNKEDKFDKPFLKELSKEVKRLATPSRQLRSRRRIPR